MGANHEVPDSPGVCSSAAVGLTLEGLKVAVVVQQRALLTIRTGLSPTANTNTIRIGGKAGLLIQEDYCNRSPSLPRTLAADI
jgi:hypothetical protein